MAFAAPQVRKLRARLNPRHVKTREADGHVLHYVEGWHVVAEVNRIFGFEGWDRETVASDCVWTKQQGSRYCAAYVARVRITVRAGETRIVREGCGVGESSALSPGQAHEFAAKAAETDATKRALMTFGNAFGLSLYGGTGATPVSNRASGARACRRIPSKLSRKHRSRRHQHRSEERPGLSSKGPSTTSVTPDHVPAADSFPGDRDEPGFRPVDKSVLALAEPRRIRDPEHLRLVASQSCLVCGRSPAEAHHLRFAQPRAMSRKVSDEFTVPLCALHHRDLHARGDEEAWWEERKIEPLGVANELWSESRRTLAIDQ